MINYLHEPENRCRIRKSKTPHWREKNIIIAKAGRGQTIQTTPPPI